tara:strand:- start:76 stop:480 length:405 start_codon:yes stop_codon:yes gene_type:complete
MIIYQKRVYPEDLEANPNVYYMFADNDKRGGHWNFRGYDNFIGIRVKNDEHAFDNSYWSDTTYADNVSKIHPDFEKVQTVLKHQLPVVYSEQTFNINIPEYRSRSPKTCMYIEKYLDFLQNKWSKIYEGNVDFG